MLVGRVIHYEIENDVNAIPLGLAGQHVEIRQRTIHGVDIFVVGDVVTEIHLRRRKARGNPNCVYAKILQVVELRRNALQVADAIVVAIGKAARINLVKHRMLPPLMTFRINSLGGNGFASAGIARRGLPRSLSGRTKKETD